ncbi:succinate dehydrogenase assembly factor 2 [Paracoccus xiamenensis]|uniref:succinate dehydrogenase assembly factor 2 n=1 Tax=Paracoccus xiamenensis TaxID=2714901 RepID=UPI00140E8C8B|nr:succinate dehydrogenase assembly factor 2 [Paracoccus xiamenensis]NHF71767.1 succinate dehydrogenase assembly factor 2 [Paracoccus xiamenensis]
MENPEIRLKRLQMRSWRRGMKEMDLILGPFADSQLADLSEDLMAQYEQVMGENDQDLYRWIMARSRGQAEGPAEISAVLDVISAFALGRFKDQPAEFTNRPQKNLSN